MESMTLLLPLPLGPTMEVKDLWKGPSTCRPAYDLKFSFSMCVMTSRGQSESKVRAGGGGGGTWRSPRVMAPSSPTRISRSSGSGSGGAEDVSISSSDMIEGSTN